MNRPANALLKAAFFPLLLFSFGCSSSSNDITQAPRQLSDDFFVTIAKVGKSLPGVAEFSPEKTSEKITGPIDERSNCEAALTKAVCETSASTQEITTRYNSVTCSQKGAQYVPALMQIYDEVPAKMRL